MAKDGKIKLAQKGSFSCQKTSQDCSTFTGSVDAGLMLKIRLSQPTLGRLNKEGSELVSEQEHQRRIGYARVSTKDQNLDLQIRALEQIGCAKIFQDKMSGAKKKRPAFDKAIQSLNEGDVLVVWKMDRAFRSLVHALNVLEDFDNRGIAFVSLTDGIDTTSATGKFFFQIRTAFAELERSLIVERTVAGIEAARQRGAKLGRPRALTKKQIAYARTQIKDAGRSVRALGRELGVSHMSVLRAM